MEIELVYSMWDVLQSLIIIGFTIGVSVMVIVSALRLGWLLAPYIFIGAFVIWLLSNM
jgi:Na+/phosphate symporter